MVRFKNEMLINITSYHIMVITLIKQSTVPLTLTAAELTIVQKTFKQFKTDRQITILCLNDKHVSF